MDAQTAAQHLSKVRDQNPLVHSITNNVVTNFTANGLLALGASPVMAYAIEEAADMAKIAGALVLNIGTLSSASVEAMIAAGKSANENGVPVIFDPVGAKRHAVSDGISPQDHTGGPLFRHSRKCRGNRQYCKRP